MDSGLRQRFTATGRVAAPLAIMLATVATLLPEPVGAQQAAVERSGITAHLGGSVLFTIQPLATPSGAEPAWGLRGKAATLSGVFGVGRRVSFDTEVTRGPEQTGVVQFRCCGGTATDSATLRETLVSAFVRWRATRSTRLLVEPVVGLTFSSGNGTQVQRFLSDSPGSIEQPVYPSEFSKRSLGLGGGADLVLPLGQHVAAVGSFRVHRLIWDDLRSLYSPAPDVSHWIVQFGGGLRFTTSTFGPNEPRPQRPAPPRGAGGAPALRGYAGVAALMFVQPTGYADGHYLSAGLGGRGFGASGVAGGFLFPHLSVEAEASIGPSLTADQGFTYAIRYATAYRDTLFSGFLRWHRRGSQRNLLEPVLGITVAAGRARRTATPYNFGGAPAGQPYDASVTRISFGVGGGADLVVPAGRGMAAVASIRMHVLKRNDKWDGPPELGIGRFVYHFGVGLQWSY